jgi:hypothetical protein
MDFRGRKEKREEGASGAIGGHLLDPRPGHRRQPLGQGRMSEAQSLNAILQTPWQLYCGLRPVCTGKHDCHCLRQKYLLRGNVGD